MDFFHFNGEFMMLTQETVNSAEKKTNKLTLSAIVHFKHFSTLTNITTLATIRSVHTIPL
jgi:hypothetical protein